MFRIINLSEEPLHVPKLPMTLSREEHTKRWTRVSIVVFKIWIFYLEQFKNIYVKNYRLLL